MIDFVHEHVVRFGEAATLLRVKYGTVHRWAKYGDRDGRKLESALIAGTAYTSLEAIQRFSIQDTAAAPVEAQPVPRDHEEAMRRLARRGATGVRKDVGKTKQAGNQKETRQVVPAL